jgi:hypothetical protein
VEFAFDAALVAGCCYCGAISGFLDLSDAEKWRDYSLCSIVLVFEYRFQLY